MEENFVKLNEDNKMVIKRRTNEMIEAAKFLSGSVSNDELDIEMKETLPGLMQNHLNNIMTAVGYTGLPSERDKEINQSVNKYLQEQIKELQALVENNNDFTPVKGNISLIGKKIDKWWDEKGFNYISELTFNKYGNINITFGFMLDSFSSNHSETPDTEEKLAREKFDNLIKDGFIFLKERNDSEKNLIDCDENRELLKKLIHSVFPTAKIMSFTNRLHNNNAEGKMYIRYMEVSVSEYEEIKNL
jgi:hypothetical protein